MGGSGDPNFSAHISSSWVKISLYTKFQLPRLPGSRNANFRFNPIIFYFILNFEFFRVGGQVTLIFPLIFLPVGSK